MGLPLKLLLLGVAGGLGSLARYGTGVLVERHATGIFPWPTFIVNMTGCLLFGAFYAFAEQRTGWGGDVRVIVLTGFMGAFTTYSTFAYQSTELMLEKNLPLALVNIVGQNVLGIVFILLGLELGKAI